MKLGTKVRSKGYSDKGNGVIVSVSKLFAEKYYDVQFADKTVIRTSEQDLSTVPIVSDLITEAEFSSIELFLTRYLLSKVDCLLTKREIVSSVNFKIQPLPHQLLAIDFVLNRFEPRCLIADEVGLGKTIEAILIYEELKLRGIAHKVLIIVPSGLMIQWQEELRLKFDEHFVIYDSAYIKSLKNTYGEECNIWDYHDQIIASVDTVKPLRIKDNLAQSEQKKREWHNKEVFEKIREAHFDIVFFDEAHKLTKKSDGATTGRYHLGKELAEVIPIVILLTATPHQGDEYLFLNLLKLIDPITFVNKDSLTPENVGSVTVRNKKRAVVDFKGKRIFKERLTSLVEINRNEEQNGDELQLYDLITSYIEEVYNLAKMANNNALKLLLILYQRITASSSFAVYKTLKRRLNYLQMGELDELDLEEYFLDDENEENLLKKKFGKTDSDIATEIEFLQRCISLAKKININFGDAKFSKLLEIMQEIKKRENNPFLKFIIFTEFIATQEAIIEFLKKYGYESSFINGDLSRDQKIEQIEDFRRKTQVLVSTDAGGEGINLQFCYCMINFDLPWNPTRLEQRIGRVDRIGQEKNVLVFNFQLTDTIEDYVRTTLEAKLGLIKKQFGEDKYQDVISLIQEEFSFEKLYIDALLIKEQESRVLDQIGDEIYLRAKQILEKNDLILPFTQFNNNPNELLDKNSNQLIESLVKQFLQEKRIEINEYKQHPGTYFFDSPFNDKHKYQQIVFQNSKACDSMKYEFINVNHPMIGNIRKSLNPEDGLVTSLRIISDKFSGINGCLFLYNLEIKNNIDRSYKIIISVFLQDGKTYNRRISNYLSDLEYLDIERYPASFDNQLVPMDESLVIAKSVADEKAVEIFYNKKNEWSEMLDKFADKARKYCDYKIESAEKVAIENIRNAKIRRLQNKYQDELQLIVKKRIIVPNLEMSQIAFVRFD